MVRRGQEDTIKMDCKETGYKDSWRVKLSQHRLMANFGINGVSRSVLLPEIETPCYTNVGM